MVQNKRKPILCLLTTVVEENRLVIIYILATVVQNKRKPILCLLTTVVEENCLVIIYILATVVQNKRKPILCLLTTVVEENVCIVCMPATQLWFVTEECLSITLLFYVNTFSHQWGCSVRIHMLSAVNLRCFVTTNHSLSRFSIAM